MNRKEKSARAANAPADKKMCSTCLEYLPHSSFSLNRARQDNLQRACKKCNKKTNKDFRVLNPDWFVKWSRKNPEKIRVIIKRYDSKLPPAIYTITNTVTGYMYIGQSRFPHRRKMDWTQGLKRGVATKMIQGKLLEDTKLYGGDKFILDFIEFFRRDVTKEHLLEREVYWISYYSKTNNLYNRNSIKKSI
jgi:hypothetical protein